MTNHTPSPSTVTNHRRFAPPSSRRLAFVAMAVPVVIGSAVGTANAQTDDDSTSDTTISTDLAAALADGRTLDGSGNNVDDPSMGSTDTEYRRVAEASYADGIGELVDGPDERYISNRIFNDSNQNIFSENDLSHWSFVWGQFIDHTISLREGGDDDIVVPYDSDDPLEEFTNDAGAIATTRSAAADGTGVDSVREQINTVSSFIDAFAVYGGSDERLDWLREGSVDGDPTNNDASLLLVDGHLPTASARPDAQIPEVDLQGRLMGDPSAAVMAGDVRVNENIGPTAVHTLFALEHNRIVDLLPDDMDEQTKFEIAQRSVAALQQYARWDDRVDDRTRRGMRVRRPPTRQVDHRQCSTLTSDTVLRTFDGFAAPAHDGRCTEAPARMDCRSVRRAGMQCLFTSLRAKRFIGCSIARG